MDFVQDALFNGERFRVLTVVDNYSKICHGLLVGKSQKGIDVVEELSRICTIEGCKPVRIQCDNGTEFVSKDVDLWAYSNGVTMDFSRPGKPTDNAYIEAFNGRFRAECLNAHWFLTLDDARQKIEDWRNYYNEVRPHGSIGHKAPISLQNHVGASSPST